MRFAPWLVTVSLALANCARASADGGAHPFAVEGAVARFHVEGIACSACANRLRDGLRELDGVADVQVDLAKKDVVVAYDAARTSAAAIRSEIVRLGFAPT